MWRVCYQRGLHRLVSLIFQYPRAQISELLKNFRSIFQLLCWYFSGTFLFFSWYFIDTCLVLFWLSSSFSFYFPGTLSINSHYFLVTFQLLSHYFLITLLLLSLYFLCSPHNFFLALSQYIPFKSPHFPGIYGYCSFDF